MPRAPCGGKPPFPDYAAPGASPNVKVWTSAALGLPWTSPGCTGWNAKSEGVLTAVAGAFRFAGSADDLLARFGAISTLTGLDYWSVTEGGRRTLIRDASALDGPASEHERADFSAAELKQGRDLYFTQSDNRSSGEVVAHLGPTTIAAELPCC